MQRGPFIVGREDWSPNSLSAALFAAFCLIFFALRQRRRHLRQKSIKNFKLRGALQFSAACIFQDEENHADNTCCIIKGFSDVLGNAGV